MISLYRTFIKIYVLVIALSLLSCVDDEVVRLQTDVTAEGEEMFNTSFTISEHVHLIIQPFNRFLEVENDTTLRLPGCPIVNVNQEERKVLLTYDPRTECPNNSLRRSGTISLFYTTSLLNNEEVVLVEYENYSVRNSRIEGSRLVTKRSEALSNLFKDTMAQLLIFDEHGSSTRVTAEYEHQVMVAADSTLQINTTGSGGGRNQAGRSFNFTIPNQKIQFVRCIDSGIFVPSIGQEAWTFERTVNPAVNHRMNFGETSDCDRNVSVVLSNGETLNLTP
ncbi:MAG TPA: hypothetical protein VK921_01440 [Anditalea sp.]|nr:hypothetical protein [Anditalea sp.]